MRIGSLFSGIGGLELGLERAGLGEVVWQAEKDPFCRAVLMKHWPEARLYTDVTHVDRDSPSVDLICGGFPCQDLSTANSTNRLKLSGAKSSLWFQFLRVIGKLSPKWVVIENVAKTWRDWVPTVREGLHMLGYSSLPFELSANSLGAPHERRRVFIVANTDPHCEFVRAFYAQMAKLQEDPRCIRNSWRNAFSGPVRMDDGFSGRLGEVRAYGNAVVPQCAEVIGLAIKGYAEMNP